MVKMERRLCCGCLILLYLQQAYITAETHRVPEYLTAVRNERRSFTSPNYPGNYPSNSRTIWRIRAELADDVVQIITQDSHLEMKIGSDHCTFDYIRVFDGSDEYSPKLKEWCGTSSPTVTSTGQILTLMFHSDSTHNEAGFRIEYVAIKAGSSDVDSESDSPGISLMAMVGYMVLVLAVLSIAMIVLRVAIAKSKFCKGVGGGRGRDIFRRRRNVGSHVPGQTARGGTDIFMIPVEPPPYEAIDLSLSPPPYSEVNPAFDQSDPDINLLNSETSQTVTDINTPHSEINVRYPGENPLHSEINSQYSEVNTPFHEPASENVTNDTSLDSSVGAHNDTLPPSYDSLLSEEMTNSRSGNIVNMGLNSIVHPYS